MIADPYAVVELANTLIDLAIALTLFTLSFTLMFREHWRSATWLGCALLVVSDGVTGARHGEVVMFLITTMLLMMGSGAILPWSMRWQASFNIFCVVAWSAMRLSAGRHDAEEAAQWTGILAAAVIAQGAAALRERYIREREQAERQIRENEEKLRKVFDVSSDVITISALADGHCIDVNPAFEISGYTRAEAIGSADPKFSLWPTTAERERFYDKIRALGQVKNIELNFKARDGTIVPCLVSAAQSELQGKQCVIAVSRDITAFKENERQLVAAREAALAASQAKSEFLSSMSHEIRTPMTAILGMAELLAEGELNTEQRRYIEIICNNGNALLDLINGILDLAKVESGRLTLEHAAFDLSEVVEKSAQTLAFRAHAKRLELIVSIAPDVPLAVLGDPLRLRQVLINLIGNAIKFTELGEIVVSVERDCAPGDPLRLKFSVRDTGIGIAHDKLPALFAAFAQADSSTARKYGGSGLGLAIVKRLVTLMHGEVTMESTLGKGSIFSFNSPFEAQPDPPAAAAPWPELGDVAVLIVDSNQTGRTMLSRMLGERGASITEVASYEAGLSAIRQAVSAGRPPRIVLLDDRIVSPDVHEFELIAESSQCGASIIAMIHCDNLAADVSRLRSLKLENYLLKPIDLRELVKALRQALMGDAVEAPPDNRSAAIDAGQPSIVDRPLKILFADNSSDNRTLIRAFLKKTHYHLDEVENGRQAIERFIAAGDYDLVLMDIQMPEVDGYAATRAIRKWELGHDRTRTPIIALTASVFGEAVRLTRAAGCDAHVGKPISKATLLRGIYDAVVAT